MLLKSYHRSHLLASACALSFAVAFVTPAFAQQDPNKIWGEAIKAYNEKNYSEAATKLKILVDLSDKSPEAPKELLRFNLGLAYLLSGQNDQAIVEFTEYLKRFPRGEYASRCYLGVGKALVAAGKASEAIEPFKKAALDPKFRSEAGLALGNVYIDLNKQSEALELFRTLSGSDVRTPAQTMASVEAVGLFARLNKQDALVGYLDRLIRQVGVRQAIAWYTNQVIIKADELMSNNPDVSLMIYDSILPRQQILEIQKDGLAEMKKQQTFLDGLAKQQESLPQSKRNPSISETLGSLTSAIDATEKALEFIEKTQNLDAALLMRRGRCLYAMDRYQEALFCFRTIRTKYSTADEVQAAAYAEIVILSRLDKINQIGALGNQYIEKYPNAENVEQVGALVGQVLASNRDWPAVLAFYKDLEKKFPNSKLKDVYQYMQANALFSNGEFPAAAKVYQNLLATFPKSANAESAAYRVAMCYFLTNDAENMIKAADSYMATYPKGQFTGDLLYRKAFIDFNNPKGGPAAADRVLKSLGDYLKSNPNDMSAPAMYSLMGDTWAQKKINDSALAKQGIDPKANALDLYLKVIDSQNVPQEVLSDALEKAIGFLQEQRKFEKVIDICNKVRKQYVNSPLELTAVNWISKMYQRMGKASEASGVLADVLRTRIGNPADEQTEMLIQQLVRVMVPRKKPSEINVDEVEKAVTDRLSAIVGNAPTPTANARIYYARALVNTQLRRPDQANLYLKGIAQNTKPADLSPQLLYVVGELMRKENDLDKAEGFFARLQDRYRESMYADAGPVGLGQIALARKQPEKALKIFTEALERNPGMSMFTDAMLGQLNAYTQLKRYDQGEKLALKIIGDKSFRGERAGKAYLDLAQIWRERADKLTGDEREQALAKASGYYVRVCAAYQAFPNVCAEGYWGSYEVLKALGRSEEALDALKKLATNPKLKNTARAAEAQKIVPAL